MYKDQNMVQKAYSTEIRHIFEFSCLLLLAHVFLLQLQPTRAKPSEPVAKPSQVKSSQPLGTFRGP